jgi:hypothetical protein
MTRLSVKYDLIAPNTVANGICMLSHSMMLKMESNRVAELDVTRTGLAYQWKVSFSLVPNNTKLTVTCKGISANKQVGKACNLYSVAPSYCLL